ncbi:Peptidyl-prolyl cis-trans isomerase-like 3 [Atta colombica]|uniref:Peptidyl-prolyl cis-trans isomerase n=1 Tax=Atta colombica TaxID=520822 RepID=A0A195BWJ0_9HYME|nr:Peptidyl-prolyl cis-trans isomerase-like 3 [Atta colombica]
MKSNLPITWLAIVSAVIFRRHLGGWAQVHKMPHAHDNPAVAGRRAKITPRCHSLSRTILRRHCRVLRLLQEKWKIQSLDFAPSHNFLALCASGYYDNCLFHRNIKGFIVQTGDPTNTGKGGTSIWNRKFEDEFKEELKHNARGLISMANNGPNTNGSQFFITYAPQSHLDLKYTLFGKVIDGLETLEQLEKLPINPKNYKPLAEIRINNITIHANPLAG